MLCKPSKKSDMESWPRREHYRYYTKALKVEFNMTARVDVQNLLRFCHAHGCKFYAAAIYCVTKALNRIENFRMFKNADGELCVWDKIVPNFTFFHPDDCTFSDCWTDFSEDFPTFYNAITADMQTYKDVKGIKTKPNQPANFYCVSCTPWTAYRIRSSGIWQAGWLGLDALDILVGLHICGNDCKTFSERSVQP